MDMPFAGASSREWMAYLRYRIREELGVNLPTKRLQEILDLVEETMDETGANTVIFGEILEHEIEEMVQSARMAGPPPALEKTHVVPRLGEAIISRLCPAKDVEAVLGDLEEGFGALVARHGLRAAHRWYWWQVLRSALPFVTQLVVRAATLWEVLRKIKS